MRFPIAARTRYPIVPLLILAVLVLPEATLAQGVEIKCNIEAKINNTLTDADDFVVLSESSPDRPFTSLILTLTAGATDTKGFKLRSSPVFDGGVVSFGKDPGVIILKKNKPLKIRLFGDKASKKENDARVLVEGPGFSCLDGTEDLTVITGIKLRFSGTFFYATDANEELPANTCADNLLWKL